MTGVVPMGLADGDAGSVDGEPLGAGLLGPGVPADGLGPGVDGAGVGLPDGLGAAVVGGNEGVCWSIRASVARLRSTQRTSTWTLYYRDRNLRFHRYDLTPPTPDVGKLLDELDRDSTAIFWG
ncbi:DUF3024 domain-containing protein [Micromonospora sp. NPDC003776]